MANRDVVEQLYGDLAAGDVPQVLAALADDVRWTESEGFVHGGTCTGSQAVVENVFARMAAEWEVFEVRSETVLAEADDVVVRGWYHGTHRETGRSFRAVHWWTVRDGRVTTFEQLCDTALVLAALPATNRWHRPTATNGSAATRQRFLLGSPGRQGPMTPPGYPADWDDKYTDPGLRARLKDEVVAGDKGGKPGQWSARKAQLLAAEYEKAGGGYRGEKDETQQHLSEWTDEHWQTSDRSADARTGGPEEKGGASRRYLPEKAWEQLSEEEKRATDARKAEGSARGEQFVPNTHAAATAGREARQHGDEQRGDGQQHDEPPVKGYDDLTAREVVRVVAGLEDEDEVRAVQAYERDHQNRKTVQDRIDRSLS